MTAKFAFNDWRTLQISANEISHVRCAAKHESLTSDLRFRLRKYVVYPRIECISCEIQFISKMPMRCHQVATSGCDRITSNKNEQHTMCMPRKPMSWFDESLRRSDGNRLLDLNASERNQQCLSDDRVLPNPNGNYQDNHPSIRDRQNNRLAEGSNKSHASIPFYEIIKSPDSSWFKQWPSRVFGLGKEQTLHVDRGEILQVQISFDHRSSNDFCAIG